jgi:ABC-type multidrug transport system ATPase subunit
VRWVTVSINLILSKKLINEKEDIIISNNSIIGLLANKPIEEDFFKLCINNCLIKIDGISNYNYSDIIDYIDDKSIESSLSVQQYINFFGLLHENFNEYYEYNTKVVLKKINIWEKRNIAFYNIKDYEKKYIRIIVTYLNNILILLSNNLLSNINDSNLKKLYNLLLMHKNQGNFCILIEDSKKNLYPLSDVIYEMK